MKTLLFSFFLGLCLLLPGYAGELLLDGAGVPSAATTGTGANAPAKAAADARVHLGLDRHGQNGTLVCELPAVQTVSSAGEAPSTMAAQDWNPKDALQALAPRASAAVVQPMATLAPSALPTGSAVNSGVADSLIYGGVAVLLLALAWVCRAGMRQSGASKPWLPGGEVAREDRARRVKMVALKV